MKTFWIAAPLLLLGGAAALHSDSSPETVGLSLFFQNSQMPKLTLAGDAKRFLQEIDIVANGAPTSTDQGIQPLIQSGDFANLDWTGVQMVEEDFRPNPDGTFLRQRFYRNATWMKRDTAFAVLPVNASGFPVGLPLVAFAGNDNNRTAADDGFVRRFNARQIASPCRTKTDCTGATFTTQALAQWRVPLKPSERARAIPAEASGLRLFWSEQPFANRTVAVETRRASDFAFGYGFQPSLQTLNQPANGSFWMPGETINLRINVKDGAGRPLNTPGSLPTYGQFLRGEIPSGLQYYDGARLASTLYYAMKHREAMFGVGLIGPTNKIKPTSLTVGFETIFLPNVPTATITADGYSGLFQSVPALAILFGAAPLDAPVSDTISFTVPADSLPGTYILAMKARRLWAGEASNKAFTMDIQVGQAAATPANLTTGPCSTCHTGNSSLSNVLHGISDRRPCQVCHATLAFEPDSPVDIRVHTIHQRSKRFDSNIQNCMQCHLTPPTGPARGLLP